MAERKSLRERVAQALYENTHVEVRRWDELPEDRRAGWLSDADAVIPIVARSAARVADQQNADGEYLFTRRGIGGAIRRLMIGWEGSDDE